MGRCMSRCCCRRAGTCSSFLNNDKRSILIALRTGACHGAGDGVPSLTPCPSIAMHTSQTVVQNTNVQNAGPVHQLPVGDDSGIRTGAYPVNGAGGPASAPRPSLIAHTRYLVCTMT